MAEATVVWRGGSSPPMPTKASTCSLCSGKGGHDPPSGFGAGSRTCAFSNSPMALGCLGSTPDGGHGAVFLCERREMFWEIVSLTAAGVLTWTVFALWLFVLRG